MGSPLALEDFYRVADALHGRRIVDAYAIRWPDQNGFEAALLILDRGHCRIEADRDTDEVLVALNDDGDGLPVGSVDSALIDRDCLSHVINRELGWSWACYNSQGYRDAIMLSLSGVVPSVIFYAIASSVCVGRLSLKQHDDESQGQTAT
jgi:Family of unknown function (DUF6334)